MLRPISIALACQRMSTSNEVAFFSSCSCLTMPRLELFCGDITTLAVDAIVNAANPSLVPGGAIGLAIHRAAGPELEAECYTLPGCHAGEAKITRGYRLSAKYVIHTVGPGWKGGKFKEAEVLAKCYRSALALAVEHGARTIAFPAISCGLYGYPVEEAAKIAVAETVNFLRERDDFERVIFTCVGEGVHAAYESALQ